LRPKAESGGVLEGHRAPSPPVIMVFHNNNGFSRAPTTYNFGPTKKTRLLATNVGHSLLFFTDHRLSHGTLGYLWQNPEPRLKNTGLVVMSLGALMKLLYIELG